MVSRLWSGLNITFRIFMDKFKSLPERQAVFLDTKGVAVKIQKL